MSCFFSKCICTPGLLVFSLALVILPIAPGFITSSGSLAELAICDIQGTGTQSPYLGETVLVSGVVFADLEDTPWKGFFIQTQDCDADLVTSDGIFVYLGVMSNGVLVGDSVEVSGRVQEYAGMTEIRASLEQIKVISSGKPLPLPVEANPPLEELDAWKYMESLEGMYVSLPEALVVGPTSEYEALWVVRSDAGIQRVFQDDPLGAGAVIEINGVTDQALIPQAKTGDLLEQSRGFIAETPEGYRFFLLGAPSISPTPFPPLIEQGPLDEIFSLATFNLSNLFDALDDPLTDDEVLSASEYQRRLQKSALTIHDILGEPDILALQEAENSSVLQSLRARPEISAEYGIVWQDSPDLRGQDIAIFYRVDHIELMDYEIFQGCTGLIDGLGPDGNQDVLHPENRITCDRNEDGILDGNRLFSRPPLVAHFRIMPASTGNSQERELVIIANHWKSKIEDARDIAYTQPRRLEEAEFVSALTLKIRREIPSAITAVIGDLNDYPGSQPLAALRSSGLADLTALIGKPQRYTLIHRGISQVIDYILVSPSIELGYRVASYHINADFPAVFAETSGIVYRSSDHDPVRVEFIEYTHFAYMPLALLRDFSSPRSLK